MTDLPRWWQILLQECGYGHLELDIRRRVFWDPPHTEYDVLLAFCGQLLAHPEIAHCRRGRGITSDVIFLMKNGSFRLRLSAAREAFMAGQARQAMQATIQSSVSSDLNTTGLKERSDVVSPLANMLMQDTDMDVSDDVSHLAGQIGRMGLQNATPSAPDATSELSDLIDQMRF